MRHQCLQNADKRGADKAGGVFRQDADENLLDELIHQTRHWRLIHGRSGQTPACRPAEQGFGRWR
jgi:hypothetical protein